MAAPTESSRLWTTGGAGDGASTFTRDQLAEMFRAMLCGDPTTQGVLSGLAVSGTSSPMTLAIGSACVYGFLYFCTVAGDVTKSTPAVGTTGFRVVLRASWAAQTVRVTVISNTDGVAAIPAVTQTASTTWDITLATGTITTGGVITLTDARDFCTSGPYAAALSVIGRSANTIGVTNEIVAANDGEVLRRSGTSLGFGTLADANMTAGGLTNASLANRTRVLSVPGVTETPTFVAGEGTLLANNVTTTIYGSFQVPQDYVSGGTLYAIVHVSNAGTLRYFDSAMWAADGEVKDANSNSNGGADQVCVDETMTAIALTALTGLAVGDVVTCSFGRSGAHANDTVNSTAYFHCFRFSYTADM